MTRAYNVVDADGHILEPLDLWSLYIDPAFRDRAPRIVMGNNGKERLVIEEHTVGDGRLGIGRIGAVGARQGVVEADTMAYKDGKPGGFDPHKRIPDMDADGIDAAFLYPSLGLFSGAIHDPELAAATCRAYNRWLADYCKPYPDRLFGVAMLPMQDVDQAIKEMTFARKELGMKGGFLRPNPYNDRLIHDPVYEPFWSAAEDLDFSIGFHEGASAGMPQVGRRGAAPRTGLSRAVDRSPRRRYRQPSGVGGFATDPQIRIDRGAATEPAIRRLYDGADCSGGSDFRLTRPDL